MLYCKYNIEIKNISLRFIMIKLQPLKINPVIRGANYTTINQLKLRRRINYAYQLFYIFKGKVSGFINDMSLTLVPGMLALYGPGDFHDFKSSGLVTFTTVCFSWEPVDAERLTTGNSSVSTVDAAYWKLADPKLSISSLPDIPFVLEMKKNERFSAEDSLRNIGLDFRALGKPLLPLKSKADLLKVIYNLMEAHKYSSRDIEHRVIRNFRKYLDENYSRQLDREQVSKEIGVSSSHLTTLLRRELNTNFTDYLTSLRMRKATELLQYSGFTVKEIAAVVGFHSCSYFIERFRQLYADTPGALR